MLALYGDIPHFNKKGNRWGTGEGRHSGHRLVTGRDRPQWLLANRRQTSRRAARSICKNVRAVVDAKTPGTPIWLMVQTTQEPRPGVPQEAAAERSASCASRSATASSTRKATGIAFHTWSTYGSYAKDERRDPAMVGYMRTIANEVHAGTFQ